MYSVYLDSVLITDPVGGIDDFVLTLERTFDSDNLFREFTETTLTFTGEAFNYLCQVLQADYCAKVPITVEINGEQIFEGQIIVSFGTLNLTKRTFETQIVDTSYRGLIRERVKNEVALNSLLTVGCEDLNPIPVISMPMRNVNNTFVRQAEGFDVYEVFRFIVSYISDNQVAFQSNFLQQVPYAITTGWNISGTDNNLSYKQYPSVSFEKLYSQFRNLCTLYASLEVVAGQPTIIMEPEGYFFQNTASGYSLTEYPHDTNITVDEDRIYSIVTIGTDDYDDESPNNAFSNLKINGWGKRNLNSCGCVFDKDNTEDLTVEWIIDSGKIIDILNSADGQDEIYIIQLNPLDYPKPLIFDNPSTGKYYYNSSLRNEIVSILWSVQFNNCVYSTRVANNSFRAFAEDKPLSPWPDDLQGIKAGACNLLPFTTTIYMFYPQVSYDEYNGLQVVNSNTSCEASPTPRHTLYECQNDGYYAFKASRTVGIVNPLPGNFPSIIDWGFIILIGVFTDNTCTTQIDAYFETLNVSDNGNFSSLLQVETPVLQLNAGNTIRVQFLVSGAAQNGSSFNPGVLFTNGVFESNDPLLACLDITPDGNRIPYLMTFEKEMCKSEYDLLNANRRNYIDINGYKGWIKKLDYNPKGVGTFELLTEQIPCCNE